jgi:cell division protease FtsH
MGLEQATSILTTKRADLESLAQGLLEYETLSGEEITGLLKGRPPIRDTGDEPAPPRPSPVPNVGKGRPKHGPETGLEPQPTA